jgi:predicted nucleotide-binding protein (sugar kinase/HSP70/actin superfamily)
LPVTFPHFGSLSYVFEVVLRELGRKDILFPRKPSKRTSELGSRHSPEFVCTPFKMTLGTFIEMLDEGATELGMGGGNAYCRFGYYWPVQKLILEDLGYDNFRYIMLDFLHPLRIWKVLKEESNGCSYLQTLRAFRIAWIKNRYTDLVDKMLYKYRPFELEKGRSEKIAKQAFRMVVETEGIRNIKKLEKKIMDLFEQNVEIRKDENPLKIVISGEIYVVIEPSLNVDVHRRLNELGVIVESTPTLRSFIDLGHKLNPFITMHFQKARRAAQPYLQHRCGGEALENIGDMIIYKNEGWDGMVHLYPFTCMPEIITRSIAPQVSREHDMPILSLVVDEHTGEAGFQTRLEAFVDLLKRRKMESN